MFQLIQVSVGVFCHHMMQIFRVSVKFGKFVLLKKYQGEIKEFGYCKRKSGKHFRNICRSFFNQSISQYAKKLARKHSMHEVVLWEKFMLPT